MVDIFLYEGEPNPNDIRLGDPTVLRTTAMPQGVIVGGVAIVEQTYVTPVIIDVPGADFVPIRIREVLRVRGHAHIIVHGQAEVSFGRYVPRTFVYEANGGAVITGDSYVELNERRVLVARAIPALLRPTGRAAYLVHAHKNFATIASGGVVASGTAARVVHQHATLDIVATNQLTVVGDALVDHHTHATLDIIGLCRIATGGDASVEFSSHVALDVVAQASAVTTTGYASVQFIPARSVRMMGHGGVVVGGVASVACIVDTLTDEELLFLLEAA